MITRKAFTLLELIAVVAILGVLCATIFPVISNFLERSRSTACASNLREIGISVLAYVGDNNNAFPIIEPNPDSPVYSPQDEAQPIYTALEPYGVTDQVLKCPSDIKGPNYYSQRSQVINGKKYGSSYQWRVLVDGENALNPKIYGGRQGAGFRIIKPAFVTICTDFESVHSGKANRLYADGHVSKAN